MKTPYSSSLPCLPRGAAHRARRVRQQAAATTAAMRLVLATAALVALTLGLTSAMDAGSKQVALGLDHALTAAPAR